MDNRFLAPRQDAFSPASLSPFLWLEADFGTFQTSGGSAAVADGDLVGEWRDKSGNNRHLSQVIPTWRPELKLAIQNGLPVIRFTPASTNHIKAAYTLAQPHHLFIAGKPTNGNVYWDGGSSTASRGWFLNGVDSLLLWVSGAGPEITSGMNNTWSIVSGAYDGASSFIRRNAASAVTGNPGTTTSNGITLGAAINGGGGTQCDLYAVLIFNRILPTADESNVRNYLNQKLAIF